MRPSARSPCGTADHKVERQITGSGGSRMDDERFRQRVADPPDDLGKETASTKR